MSRSLGRAPCHTTCSKCGTEVEFAYWWDRATYSHGYEDTEHEAPDGSKCDLSDADCENEVEMMDDGYDDREPDDD